MTFIFEDGLPMVALRTNAGGFIERISLDIVGGTKHAFRKLRLLLVEFGQEHGYDIIQSDSSLQKFCRVIIYVSLFRLYFHFS
jgi:hypothetical protein